MNYPFFTPLIKEEYINQRVTHIKSLLERYGTHPKNLFLKRLDTRLNEFKISLKYESKEKNNILKQYNAFTKTLLFCLEKPYNAQLHINHYLDSPYFPVGALDMEPPNPLVQTIAISGLTLGLALLASSIPAFIFNPSLGAVAVALAITFLLPSLFNLCLPKSFDVGKKKVQDKELFLEAVDLVAPEVNEQFDTNQTHTSCPI